MKKEKTLILTQTDPETDVMYKKWVENAYNADIIFKPVIKIGRLIRRIWIQNGFPLAGVWYGKWKEDLRNYDTLIIHASSLTQQLPNWIEKKYPNMRIIYWYWNPVTEKTDPSKVKSKNAEFWSFDKKDCEKYGMNYNIQYYCMDNGLTQENLKIDCDVFFVGHEKGRGEQIQSIGKILRAKGIKCDFRIVSNKFIPYHDVERRVVSSKAILEILQNGQSGMTLRALESLFWEKKLITNNELIKNEKFYNKNNIFIIGIDDENEIEMFLKKPYDKSSNKYKSEYDIDAWYENFEKRKSGL